MRSRPLAGKNSSQRCRRSSRITRPLGVSAGIVLIFILFLIPSLGRSSQRFSEFSVDLETRLSPVLREELAFRWANPDDDRPIPVIVLVDGDFFAFNQALSRQSGRVNPNALSLVHA